MGIEAAAVVAETEAADIAAGAAETLLPYVNNQTVIATVEQMCVCAGRGMRERGGCGGSIYMQNNPDF